MADAATRFTDTVHSDIGFTQGDPNNPTPVGPVVPATQAAIGGVKEMAPIANIAAAPTQGDFNGLLAALRTAGILAP